MSSLSQCSSLFSSENCPGAFQSVALVDRTSRPETICLLRVEDLPEDTQERFNHLFALREKWTEDDITPYIKYWSLTVDFSYKCIN